MKEYTIKLKNAILNYFKHFNLIGLAIIIILILLDQITKIAISSNMFIGQSIKVINKFFYITYSINIGAAWSSFEDQYGFLMLVTIIAMIFFLYLYKDLDFKNKKFYSISVPMMIAGTIGNLIDRLGRMLFNGKGVVDFLDFVIFGYDFPIFNVADMCLVIGIIMMGIDMIFFEPKRKKELADDQGSN